MADNVLKGGLILTDWADNMAKVDANRYLNVQRQQQQEEYARQQALETAANQARQQYAGGNIEGAKSIAAAGNAWGAWDSIDANQKAQVAAQATDIGGAAYNLTRLPKGQQRIDYFNAFVPTLKSHGMSDQEIAQYAHSGFLDNDDALHGYADKAVGISNLWKADQERQKAEYDRETDLMKPTTAADGAVLTRGADGSYSPVYLPGSKPESQFIKNEDGSTSYVSIPGTAGTSYAPGTGDKSRLMNYEARAKGFGAVPDSVQNLGQFSDYASSLNRQGVKSSAAGDFQIVGDTMRRYAPKVLGPDWRSQPFNSATQDRVAEGIFVDNRGSAAALRKQWVSLSMAEAERIRHLPWAQARLAILAGESSGGSAPQGAGPRQGSNGIQTVNLGGGRTGPLWKDENRTINGQTVNGQANQQTGEFKPYTGAAGKPQADNSQAVQSLDDTISTVDRIVKHPGLSSVVGVPGFTGGLLGGKIIPGTNAAGFASLMKNFNANAFLAQVAKMKGAGALSDAEGQKLSAAIGAIDTSQSESDFIANFGIVREGLVRAKQNLLRKTGGQPSTQTKTVNGRTYVKVQGGWKAQ